MIGTTSKANGKSGQGARKARTARGGVLSATTKTTATKTDNTKTDDTKTKLEGLATTIQAGHLKCMDALKGVIGQAKAIGESLIEAKNLMKHGQWNKWVNDNCRFSTRMAQHYMKVANHYEKVVARFEKADECTLTEFIELASKRREKPQQAAATPETNTKAFHLTQDEVAQRQQRLHDPAGLPAFEKVVKADAVAEFVKKKVDFLYAAVLRFAASEKFTGLTADGMDTADVGILLVESLKAALDPVGLFPKVSKADAVSVEPTPEASPMPTTDEVPQPSANGTHGPSLTV